MCDWRLWLEQVILNLLCLFVMWGVAPIGSMEMHRSCTRDEKEQLHTSPPQYNDANGNVIVIHTTNILERDHNKQNKQNN